MKKLLSVAVASLALAACAAMTQTQTSAIMHMTTDYGNGQGVEIGKVIFTDTDQGLKVIVNVQGLTPGEHGFHVHQNPSCAPTVVNGKIEWAGAAGGHYDPAQTGVHAGPSGGGHKGDLKPLYVDMTGKVNTSFFVHGVTADEFKNHSLIIHAGGDNFADTPYPLGGGGARFACGIIK